MAHPTDESRGYIPTDEIIFEHARSIASPRYAWHIEPYGYLEGFDVRFERPLPNMNANACFVVSIDIQHPTIPTPHIISFLARCRSVRPA